MWILGLQIPRPRRGRRQRNSRTQIRWLCGFFRRFTVRPERDWGAAASVSKKAKQKSVPKVHRNSWRQRPTLTLFIKSRCIIQLLLHKTHESRIVPPSLSWCCYLCKFIWTAAAGDYLYVHLPKIGARNIQRKVARRSSPGRNWCFSFVSRFGSFVWTVRVRGLATFRAAHLS